MPCTLPACTLPAGEENRAFVFHQVEKVESWDRLNQPRVLLGQLRAVPARSSLALSVSTWTPPLPSQLQPSLSSSSCSFSFPPYHSASLFPARPTPRSSSHKPKVTVDQRQSRILRLLPSKPGLFRPQPKIDLYRPKSYTRGLH